MPVKHHDGQSGGGHSIAITHFVQRKRRNAEVSWPSATDPAQPAGSQSEVSIALSLANGPLSLEWRPRPLPYRKPNRESS
jgi:hypothetical protein